MAQIWGEKAGKELRTLLRFCLEQREGQRSHFLRWVTDAGFRFSHLKWEVPVGHLGPSGRWEAICMLSSGTRSRLGRCTWELAADRWHLKPWVTQGRGVCG